MDARLAFKTTRRAVVIGISSLLCPLVVSIIVQEMYKMPDRSQGIPIERWVGMITESVTYFSVIAWLLGELKILNSELGASANNTRRQANQGSLHCDHHDVSFCMFTLWLDRSPLFGAFLVGLAVPDGPPLGSTMIEKSNCLANGVFVLIYVTTSTMRVNSKKMIPMRDSLAFALIMSSKGIVELSYFSSFKDSESPNVVYALHLIELVDRDSPVFIAHQNHRNQDVSSFHHIAAFNQYEKNNWETVTVNAFTAISPSKLMHEDVCTLALHKQASFILLPFHRKWVLIDRRRKPFMSSASTYSVGMISLGGKDDREALTLAKRITRDPKVKLTMIHLIADEERRNVIDWDTMLDAKRRVMVDAMGWILSKRWVYRTGAKFLSYSHRRPSCIPGFKL
ncbi:hypothetical protein F3Y22_tig00112000pilonHSYRG00069 [Hibiscus syriacus]|uniref:Cation/H(+) antiporter central domain-containing protein n=1 Tax=Hibiscus syriacus TaxID=106335 RepID=A0A6A2X756_HIBSY|nr:hypothetical protein F3Y22_tig00112000pilonHSYRG00069 [Hibiscus syriacus]